MSALAFFLPGLGERTVSMRIRLSVALLVTAILVPMIIETAPRPATLSAATLMIAAEAVAGILLGFSIRLAIYIIQTAGAIASQHLSLAQLFGSGIDFQPEPPIATLLMIAGVALALSTGLHFKAVAVLASSYEFLPVGQFPGASATGEWAAERAGFAFSAALSLALPFVVIGFVYNLGIGAANRAMPQLMVAFVGMPAITLAGLILLAMTAPVLLDVCLQTADLL